MNHKKILAVVIAGMILLSGPAAYAQTTTSTPTSTSSLQQTVEALLRQIQQLQEQMQQLKTQQKDLTEDLLTTLNAGSVGDAVKILQAVLSIDPDIYPEGRITGFFGALTRRAVMNFQRQNGLPQVGNVGPRTLEKLKEKLKNNPLDLEDADNEGKRPCAIVPPGHLIAPGWLRKHDGIRPVVPPCQKLPPGIRDRMGTSTLPNATSTPDSIAPIISRIRSNEATSSVVITWNTNEKATSQVMYGTSTALGSNTTLDTDLVTRHSQTLSGLAADTAYHFEVQSKDAAGNLATSSQRSFATDSTPGY